MASADMAHCALKNFSAEKCVFARVNFFRMLLKGADLRTSDISGAAFSGDLCELKGAKINMMQGAALLRALGIDAE